MNPRKWQQLLGALAILAVLWLIWLVTRARDRGIDVFARSGYWIMFAMLGAWLAAACATLPWCRRRQLALPCLLAAAGVAVCFASAPIEFKVLSDETNLLSVSQSMYQNKTALHPTMGKFYYDNFHATFVSVPSRPLVFPFLLSLVHSLTAYHAWNVFIFNAVVLFLLLFVVSAVTQQALGARDAVAASLLVLSQPIIQITAASGGFDLLSVLVMLGALLAARRHMQIRSPDSLALVWMTLLIYAQVRYESIIAVPLVMGCLILQGYVTAEMLSARVAYYAAGPLFLFPWFLQRRLNGSNFENPPGVPPFSGDHFLNHLEELISVNLDFDFFYPYDNLLNIAAVVILAALVVSGARRKFANTSPEQRDFLILSALVVGSGLAVFLAHHMGKASHPTQARFFIPLSVALAGVPLLARRFRPTWFSSTALLAASVILFAVYQPIVGESRLMRTLILPRETRLAMNYLATFGHQRLLIISDRSGQYAALGVGAVDFPTARRDAEGLLLELEQRLFDEILVFQTVELSGNQPIEDHQLPDAFRLETVVEYQVTSERKLRIARSFLP